MRTTHTYATMEVSEQTYDEIFNKLKDAEYWHCIDHDEGFITLQGVALVKENTSIKNDDEQR